MLMNWLKIYLINNMYKWKKEILLSVINTENQKA